jgi:hypothetical protein
MVPISAAAVMERRLSVRKSAVLKGTIKEKIYRSATNIFTKNIRLRRRFSMHDPLHQRETVI